jgi:hypothetical protein
MKNITDRGRKTLSRVFRVISVSAASLILHACIPPDPIVCEYGMPPPDPDYVRQTSIYGKVVSSKDTDKPIFGIKVSIGRTGYWDEKEYWDYTDKDGRFSFYIPTRKEYKLKLEDVDGPYHGGLFKEQTWTIKQEDTYYTVLIGMDLDTAGIDITDDAE